MPTRCPNGTRRNKKTGLCESTTSSTKSSSTKKTTTKKSSTTKKTTTKKTTTARCPKGTRRNKKTGLCDAKPEPIVPAPEPIMPAPEPIVLAPEPTMPAPEPTMLEPEPTKTYAHHVKFTIRYNGNFTSEQQLAKWFESGDNSSYVHPDPEDDEVFNFKYKAEIVKKRYGYQSNDVHVEFDTNKDEEYIIHSIIGSMEMNDSDGNYPINGELVTGDVIDDTIYISNTEQYS